jgi:hypothetical protein
LLGRIDPASRSPPLTPQVMLMVKAGDVVDNFISQVRLSPSLWRMPLSSLHVPLRLTAAWRLQEILTCSPACKRHCIHHRNDPPWA